MFGLYAKGEGVHFSGDLFLCSMISLSVILFAFGSVLPLFTELPVPHLSTGLIE